MLKFIWWSRCAVGCSDQLFDVKSKLPLLIYKTITFIYTIIVSINS